MVKALNYNELKSYLHWLEDKLVGAQLQDCWTNGEIIVLELYKQKTSYLVLDLRIQSPSISLCSWKPPVSKKPKPMTLFLNAHAKNLRLTEIYASAEKGRVVDLWFENKDEKCHCEIILIPRLANMSVESAEKKVFWEKPKELLAPNQISDSDKSEEIDWLEWNEQKLKDLFAKKEVSKESKSSVEKIVEKKTKAIATMQESLNLDLENSYRELGEILKSKDPIPVHLEKFYNSKLSRAENREKAFQKAKDLIRKKKGTLERIEVLKKEIETIQKSGVGEKPTSVVAKMLHKTESKARKLVLENGVEAVIGKSASDNLSILRQARAWDLWLHLKDYPGAHAVIFHDKNRNVTPSQIEKVAKWVIAESRKISIGAKYDVVVVECRYVRPIKGDKLGRVTYNHPQNFTFSSERA
jgi:predicted ribosome quality control (RQC) complex YloA/Tae2 family protein